MDFQVLHQIWEIDEPRYVPETVIDFAFSFPFTSQIKEKEMIHVMSDESAWDPSIEGLDSPCTEAYCVRAVAASKVNLSDSAPWRVVGARALQHIPHLIRQAYLGNILHKRSIFPL